LKSSLKKTLKKGKFLPPPDFCGFLLNFILCGYRNRRQNINEQEINLYGDLKNESIFEKPNKTNSVVNPNLGDSGSNVFNLNNKPNNANPTNPFLNDISNDLNSNLIKPASGVNSDNLKSLNFVLDEGLHNLNPNPIDPTTVGILNDPKLLNSDYIKLYDTLGLNNYVLDDNRDDLTPNASIFNNKSDNSNPDSTDSVPDDISNNLESNDFIFNKNLRDLDSNSFDFVPEERLSSPNSFIESAAPKIDKLDVSFFDDSGSSLRDMLNIQLVDPSAIITFLNYDFVIAIVNDPALFIFYFAKVC
jgi:hypothetical protein